MKLSRQILIAFSIVILLSVIDSYINYTLSNKVKRNIDFLSNSEAIIRNSSQLHKKIIEMQSGFRGFLLTSDLAFLNSYHQGLSSAPALFKTQKSLVSDRPDQLRLLDSINFLHQQWITYANALIKAKRENLNSDPNDTYSVLFETKLKKLVGKKLNDEIAVLFYAFDKNEYKIRRERRELLIASIETTHWYSVTFLTLTIFVGILSTWYIIRLITRRIRKMVLMAENISRGEFGKVQDSSNDELTGLSSSLNIMSEKLSKNITELEKRNHELNQFAYVVSHDLKAPVRGIYNVTQWIEEDLGDELSPQLKKYLDIIPQRTRRMEDLINGLLDYARIREKTELELVDTQTLVTEITESIVPRGWKVETYHLPIVFSERLKLEQVFTNLISNAVKYIPHDFGHIIISCNEKSDYYEFSVSDNGIGIDPEYHEKIFEIFQTLRKKNEKESTGIGLAITKKIIDEQHCTIRVNSEKGKGAEFIFTWPRIKVTENETV